MKLKFRPAAVEFSNDNSVWDYIRKTVLRKLEFAYKQIHKKKKNDR